jgi:hypothetical protein
MNRQQEMDNTNVRVTTAPTPLPQTTIIQQPAPVQQQPPPVIVQQPPTTTTQPIVVTPPPTTTTSSSSTTETASGTDDATVQANIDRKIADDSRLASLGVIATVANGKVTLTGTVDTADLKRSVERAVKSVKGVRSVDNQITVVGGAAPSTSPE